MGKIKSTIENGKEKFSVTFRKYPLVVICALMFTMVTFTRIYMNWSIQIHYNFLFNVLHLTLAFASTLSLLLYTISYTGVLKNKFKYVNNSITIISTVLVFLLLYYFGLGEKTLHEGIITNVSDIARSRIIALIIINTIMFILVSGYDKSKFFFHKSLFMFQKSFFIALIYGIVIMIGTSAVAGAIQGLIYRDMSSKVYMYLGAVSSFLSYMVFIGYFPDYQGDEVEGERKKAYKHPKFIEILFQYIMTPLIMALSLVLIIWIFKTIFTGIWPTFEELSSIIIMYFSWGIWLGIMNTQKKSDFSRIYLKFFPYVSLFILVFSIVALFNQINSFGIKENEYIFILIMILSFIYSISLIINKTNADNLLPWLISLLTLISIFPYLGYHSLPVEYQTMRLENILEKNNMLENGLLVKVSETLDLKDRQDITDAVDYLRYKPEKRLHPWLRDLDLKNSNFEEVFGFEKVWYKEIDKANEDYKSNMMLNIRAIGGSIDISGYDWAISFKESYYGYREEINEKVQGKYGEFEITLEYREDGIPNLIIKKDEYTIVAISFYEYFTSIIEKYRSESTGLIEVPAEEITMEIDEREIRLKIVFDQIYMIINPETDEINYNINLSLLLIEEK